MVSSRRRSSKRRWICARGARLCVRLRVRESPRCSCRRNDALLRLTWYSERSCGGTFSFKSDDWKRHHASSCPARGNMQHCCTIHSQTSRGLLHTSFACSKPQCSHRWNTRRLRGAHDVVRQEGVLFEGCQLQRLVHSWPLRLLLCFACESRRSRC
jgi:hypothetical protein